LARAFFTFATLVGAAMCSAFECGTWAMLGAVDLGIANDGERDEPRAMSALPPKADV
jgi:hypothetical protein